MSVAIQTREERIKTLKNAFHALMWIAMRQFSQRLQSFGLTHPQFITLASLTAHEQACTMRDLTNVTFQDPPTMTGIVDRLVKIKLDRPPGGIGPGYSGWHRFDQSDQ